MQVILLPSGEKYVLDLPLSLSPLQAPWPWKTIFTLSNLKTPISPPDLFRPRYPRFLHSEHQKVFRMLIRRIQLRYSLKLVSRRSLKLFAKSSNVFAEILMDCMNLT